VSCEPLKWARVGHVCFGLFPSNEQTGAREIRCVDHPEGPADIRLENQPE